MAHFLTNALQTPGPWGLRIERTGRWLVRTLEIASDSESRKKGLLGRDALAPEIGFVIAPSQGVHTFGMRFPIDVAFCDRYGFVPHAVTMRPRRISRPVWRSYFTIEAPEGALERWKLEPGDVVEIKG